MKAVTTVYCLLISLLVLRCSHQPQNWSSGMRGMAEAYTQLLPFIYDSSRYRDSKNKKFINLYLRQLNENAGSLSKHTGKGLSGDDPLFAMGLKNLKSTLEKSSEAYFAESYDYSQKLLQTSLNYCNSCHTRTSMGPTLVSWDQFESLPEQPSVHDKVKILVATRRFPAAVDTLKIYLQQNNLSLDKKLSALKLAVFISLKNLESPQRALSIVSAQNMKTFPEETRTRISAWEKYLKTWPQQEMTIPMLRKTYLESNQSQRPDHFVASVYESMVLHKALSQEVDKLWRSRIYYQLGEIYRTQLSVSLWELPDAYYEACIYEFPASKMALKCYYSLEKILLLDNQGVPSKTIGRVDRVRLSQLRSIASPARIRDSSTSGDTMGGGW